MKKPEDTSRRPAGLHIAGAMSQGGVSGYIEGMEADGQRQLVASESLPTEFNIVSDELRRAEEALVRWGFKLGEPFPDDPIFRPVELPPGWKKEVTDHSMWSKVVDEHGRERISVFYKAASYDRRAFMSLVSRYGSEYEKVSREVSRYAVVDRKTGEQLAVFEGEFGDVSEKCSAFIQERWPDSSDPMLWDDVVDVQAEEV